MWEWYWTCISSISNISIRLRHYYIHTVIILRITISTWWYYDYKSDVVYLNLSSCLKKWNQFIIFVMMDWFCSILISFWFGIIFQIPLFHLKRHAVQKNYIRVFTINRNFTQFQKKKMSKWKKLSFLEINTVKRK